MALATFATLRPANGTPGDIFTSAEPVITAEPPKATALQDGDTTVSEQTGALQYSYPIQVPPGRHGIQPHLALTYSSQAPIYGGIAAGWSLSIPEIREDTSAGRLRQQTTGTVPTYVSSLAGGRPLIKVNDEPTSGSAVYRISGDDTFARYQQTTPSAAYAYWNVQTPDGMTYLFGDQRNIWVQI